MSERSLIDCQTLGIGYDGACLVDQIDLSIAPGDVAIVIGHNGAGKSTFLKTLFGLIPKVEGTCQVLGHDPYTEGPARLVENGVRYLGQEDRCFHDLSVHQHRQLLYRLYGSADADDGSRFPFAEVANSRRVGSLSGGQRRLEGLGLIASGSPRAILMDEASAGLDDARCRAVRDWVGRRRDDGVAFLLIEHDFLPWLDLCTKVLILREGAVSYSGPPDELREDPEWLKTYYL